MANGKLPLIGLTAATLALSACVIELWQVSYPGPEEHQSGALDVAVTDNNEAVLFVTSYNNELSERSIFVVKYDDAGNKLWEHEAPGIRQGNFPGNNRFITTDTDGAVFFAGFAQGDPITFTKLSADGDFSWERTIESDFNFPTDIKTVGNQMALLLEAQGTTYYKLHAYSSSGDHLWTLESPGNCTPFGCATELDNTTATTAPPPYAAKGELAVLEDNTIIFNSVNALYQLNAAGDITAEISAETAGVSGFSDIADNGSNLVALAETPHSPEALILNRDLDILVRHTVEIPLGTLSALDINRQNLICLATMQQNALDITEISAGTLWTRQVASEGNFELLAGVSVSETGKCYVSAVESKDAEPRDDGTSADRPISSKTLVYNTSGKLTDEFGELHFLNYSTRVKGNQVFSAGVSGLYVDGKYNAATKDSAILYKHRVR